MYKIIYCIVKCCSIPGSPANKTTNQGIGFGTTAAEESSSFFSLHSLCHWPRSIVL